MSTKFLSVAAGLLALSTCAAGEQPVLTWHKSPYALKDGEQGHRYGDRLTQIHEDTHGVNNLLRNTYGGACYYVDGKFTRVREPGTFTLADVAANCKWRGQIFKTYLIDAQRWWNGQPITNLYDEWVAYTAGAQAGVGGAARGRSSDTQFALEFSYYTLKAWQLIPENHPSRKTVGRFWVLNAMKVLRIADQSRRTGVGYSQRQDAMREWLRTALQRSGYRVPDAPATTPRPSTNTRPASWPTPGST